MKIMVLNFVFYIFALATGFLYKMMMLPVTQQIGSRFEFCQEFKFDSVIAWMGYVHLYLIGLLVIAFIAYCSSVFRQKELSLFWRLLLLAGYVSLNLYFVSIPIY